MECTRCGSPAVSIDVPSILETYVLTGTIAACTHCLALDSVESAVDADRDLDDGLPLDSISDALPSGETGVAALLLIDRLDSLATNRSEIEALVGELERGGADPLLVLDRLGSDPDLDPAVDLDRRARQLEQLVL